MKKSITDIGSQNVSFNLKKKMYQKLRYLWTHILKSYKTDEEWWVNALNDITNKNKKQHTTIKCFGDNWNSPVNSGQNKMS